MGLIIAYLSTGVGSYSYVFKEWHVQDSLYFSVMTFTTVEFGDIQPTSDAGKNFACIFALSGTGIIGIPLEYKSQNMLFLHEQFKCFFLHKIIIQPLRTHSILDWITKFSPVHIMPRILLFCGSRKINLLSKACNTLRYISQSEHYNPLTKIIYNKKDIYCNEKIKIL